MLDNITEFRDRRVRADFARMLKAGEDALDKLNASVARVREYMTGTVRYLRLPMP